MFTTRVVARTSDCEYDIFLLLRADIVEAPTVLAFYFPREHCEDGEGIFHVGDSHRERAAHVAARR